MARIDIPEGDEEEIYRFWLLHPEMANAVFTLASTVYEKSELSVREREVARMRIAQINDCNI